MKTPNRPVLPRPPVPAVEFSRHMIVVVGLGTRRSTGFTVGIRSVTVRRGRLEVDFHETCPDGGMGVGTGVGTAVGTASYDGNRVLKLIHLHGRGGK